ncbi:MAG: hypothetical protein M5U18_04270 [Dehalococcoidia bacterium]|nr:hypothetical protein [Dehalococcoidia bacterium]
MPRYYVSIPYGWLEAESPKAAAARLIADDPATNHEGVTFLIREEGSNHLVLVVVGDDDEPTPRDAGRHGRLGVPLRVIPATGTTRPHSGANTRRIHQKPGSNAGLLPLEEPHGTQP